MRRLLRRILTTFRHGHAEEDLAREMAAHLAVLEDEYQRRGMTVEDATDAAKRAMGGIEQAKEHHREVRAFRWVDDLRQDLRFATRLLVKERWFTCTAVVVLALGIGANNTFFAFVNAICLKGLPIERPDRIMFVGTRDAQDRPGGMSYRDFDDVRRATDRFGGVAAFASAPMTIGDETLAPARVSGAYVSAGAFEILGEHPVLGREFRPNDERPGAPAVALLSGGLWQSRYARDPAIIGRTVRVNGVPSVVIGVMPDGFRFPNNDELWRPTSAIPGLEPDRRDVRRLGMFGRLEDDVTRAEAQVELDAIGEQLARQSPATDTGVRLTIIPINERFTARVTDRAWIAFITAGVFVVLIACANVASLLMMRSVSRSREIAVRVSLGATRGRVVRQMLVESALLAAFGGTLGLALSLVSVHLLASMIPEGMLPYWMAPTLDGRVLTILATVCLGSVFVFGLAPALHLAKISPNAVLKDAGRVGMSGVRARRWTTVFLAAEFGLSLALLTLVAVNVRNVQGLQRVEPSIDSSGVITLWVTLPDQTFPTAEARTAFAERLSERLTALAPVASATFASALPVGGGAQRQLQIEGRQLTSDGSAPLVLTVMISEPYFATLRVPMLRGRPFTVRDGTEGQRTAIINEQFRERYFPTADPLGQRLRLTSQANPDADAPSLTIVGVAPSVRQNAAGLEPSPVVYVPLRVDPPSTTALMVRSDGDPGDIVPLLRDEVRALDPDLPLYRVMRLDQAMRQSRWNGRMSLVMAYGIAFLALALALVGIYATTARGVAQRTQEIGTRMALGALPGQVQRLVLWRAVAQLAVGLAVGVVFTFGFDRLFTGADSPYRQTDALVLLPTIGFITIVAIAACIVPARRATKIDPLVALRYE